jgi:pimeloyl-ACP methyl ester carboxylesterase
VEFVRRRSGAAKIAIMGWSWGTVIVGAYAARAGEDVAKLVQVSPLWVRPARADAAAPLGAYRAWTMASARADLQKGAPDDQRDTLMPRRWIEAWDAATHATDPEGAAMDPPVVRSPAGATHDGRVYWGAGKPYYDPALITAPTLIVRGAWDELTPRARAEDLYALLVRAPKRALVEIPEATHAMMLERNRDQLFEAVQRFLDEA